MFCPVCRYEYRGGFYVCSDCSVDLVDKLEEVKTPEIRRPSFAVYKMSLKRVRIALGIVFGFFICTCQDLI